MREITYVQAIREALQEELRRDNNIFIMGEDIRWGAHGSTMTLFDEFGKDRIISTPISENGFTGMCIGAAEAGKRPIVEIMYSNFIFLALDQILNQASKIRYMSGGQVKVPLVIRTVTGARGAGAAHHSDTPYPLFLNFPGLKVIYASTAYDVKGLLKSAIRDDNPVIFFEGAILLSKKWPVPEDEYLLPIGKADIKKSGTDVTVVAIGPTVGTALSVASQLEDKVSIEVIDPRTLVPLDEDTILASVQKTGHLVIIEDTPPVASLSSEIAALVSEKAYPYLKGAICRVNRLSAPVPFSPPLEKYVLPSKKRLTEAISKITGI